MTPPRPHARPQRKQSPLAAPIAFSIVAVLSAFVGLVFSPAIIVAVVFAFVGAIKAGVQWRGFARSSPAIFLALFALVTSLAGFAMPFFDIVLAKQNADARRAQTSARLTSIHAAFQTYADDNNDWLPESPDGLARLAVLAGLPPQTFYSLDSSGQDTRPFFYAPPSGRVSDHPRPDRIVLVYDDPRLVRMPAVLFLDGSVRFMEYLDLRNALISQKSPPPPHRDRK